MARHGQRTVVVTVLAGVIGFRIAASTSLWDSATTLGVDPQAAVATALSGWTAQGTLGSATAEGVRTLPLAAYYLAGDRLGLSAHALQIGLRALLLIVAVIGTLRLTRAKLVTRWGAAAEPEPHEPWTPWLAAGLYGCGATVVAAVAHRPMDGLAAALAPWILAPLAARRQGWGAAARSAVWLGPVGFASTHWATAVLLMGALAAAPRRTRELSQSLRWGLLALLASSWWIAAAVWEQAHATDVSQLTGAGGLAAELGQSLGWPDLPAAVALTAAAAPIVVSILALAMRAPGLDRFLVAGLTLGAVVGIALLGSGIWRPSRFAVAGAPIPPLLGPPLMWASIAAALALTPLVSHLRGTWRAASLAASNDSPHGRSRQLLVAALACLVLLSIVLPALLAARERVPSAQRADALWDDVAAWSAAATAGRVLVLPASSEDTDRPAVAEALTGRPWIDRSAVPLSGSAPTRALDEAIGRLRRAHLGAGTSIALDQLGISYVLISEDPDRTGVDTEGNALARAALLAEGATRVAAFHADADPTGLRDFGVSAGEPGIEIWQRPAAAEAWLYPTSPLPVAGDVGSVTDLADSGLAAGRPIQVVEPEPDHVTGVLSDSARRRDIDQRVPIDPYGTTLQAEQLPSVTPAQARPAQTSERLVSGARLVTASSSSADVTATDRRVATGPVAAVDDNPFTAWESRAGTGVGEWWELDLAAPADLSESSVLFRNDIFTGHTVTEVRVATEHGAVTMPVTPGEPLRLGLAQPAQRLRLEVTEVSKQTSETARVGITEVSIPGLELADQLDVPDQAGTWILSALPGSSATCVPSTGAYSPDSPVDACDEGLSVQGLEQGPPHRVLHSPGIERAAGRLWLRPVQSKDAAALADELAAPSVRAQASSVAASDLRTRAQAAADADRGTAWRPAANDPTPRLTLSWDEPALVSRVRLDLVDPAAASIPTQVRVSTPAGSLTTSEVGADGSIVLPPTTTQELTLEFLADSGLSSMDSLTGAIRDVPIAISEVAVDGVPVRYSSDAAVDLPCGSGPEVTIAGQTVQSRLSTSAGAIVRGEIIPALLCSRFAVPAGEASVSVEPSFRWTTLGLVLGEVPSVLGAIDTGPDGEAATVAPIRLDLGDPATSTSAFGSAASGDHTLALSVPAGMGWTLTGDEGVLAPVTLSGWAQGWLIPAGSGEVELVYSAGRTLRAAALGGALAWAMVALLALSTLAAGSRSESGVDAATR